MIAAWHRTDKSATMERHMREGPARMKAQPKGPAKTPAKAKAVRTSHARVTELLAADRALDAAMERMGRASAKLKAEILRAGSGS